MAERGALFVGTSGFSYKEWKGTLYPEDLPNTKMLSHYSTVLPSVEINYTFRRLPAEKTIENWRGQAAEGFRITLKASQRITHIKRLDDVQEEVDEFLRRAKGLGDHLGAVLFQCPPSLRYEKDRLEGFLATLPPVCDYAMEFRHESWKDPEARGLLQSHNVALCGADWDEQELEEVPLTASHAYLRLRKDDYSDDGISLWAKRISPVLDEGSDVYAYFKHEEGARSPRFAQALREAVTT